MCTRTPVPMNCNHLGALWGLNSGSASLPWRLGARSSNAGAQKNKTPKLQHAESFEQRKTFPVVRTEDFLTCFDIGRVDLSLKFPSPGVLQREYSDRHSLPEDFTAVKTKVTLRNGH